MLNTVFSLIARDLRLSLRRQADIASVLFFFIIVVSLFPLGVGPEPVLLRKLAPGVLWVAALLATMLSLPRLFADDHRDGSLEQLALSPQPLGLIVLGKVAAHWLVSGLPLTLLAPVLGLQFDLSTDALQILTLSLLILPLYIPVLIFGAGAVEATVTGVGAQAHLSLLGALTLAGVFFAPWPTAAALRIALE